MNRRGYPCINFLGALNDGNGNSPGNYFINYSFHKQSPSFLVILIKHSICYAGIQKEKWPSHQAVKLH